MIDQYSIIVEPKYQVSICKDILRDFSKKSVLEPQVKFIKQSLIQQIEKIDEKQDESINILRRIFDKECEKIINLEDFALNFAVQEKLEQIWQQQSTRFIEQMKENYKNRQEAEFNLLNLLNFIYLIIKRHNSSGQSCNFFLYLWKQTPLSPSIFDVFIYCDDWELSYRIIQILQDIKFEEAIKFQIKPSIVQQSFEQQIHMGFYLFTNIVIAMTSQNHFHHKNRYNSLVEYKYDEVILFKKRGSSSFLVTNLQNLNLGQGDIIYKFDISSQNNEKRNQSLWDHFLQTIGEQTYLESNKSQKQIEIFEAFIEFKYAVLCKENFNQAAYFQIFYRRLASFASSNIIQKLEKKGWIYRNGEEVQQDEVQQLKKDQLFRLAWDIILYENGNILHYLQEQYKIESDLFGKIEDFIFQYYLNTKNNAFIYTYEDMQFPNGANIDTSSGFFQLFFQQFKNCYEKIIFSNDNCPVKKKLHDYDNSITVWQIQMLTNVLNQPETFQGKQGIISQIQYNELIRRYNDQFRITITDLFKDIFIMILDRCLDTQNNNQLTDIFIHRFVINCSSLISDQKKLEIIQLKGVQYFDQLFQQILTCKNRHAAFTFLMLLEHSSEVLRNQIIEFIVTSKQTPLFQPVLIEEDKQNPQMNSSQSQDIEEKSEKDPQVEQEDVEQIRKNIILSVAESLIKDYGFCYDIFMNLSKTDPFSLNCKQDLEKNNKIYNLYVKYYPQIYLNKGTVMMHTQFFNQPGIKLQLRNQLLKSGVLQAIVEKIEMDYELELNYYINNIKKENLICKQTYKTMLNAKYTFLIHNTKQYIDTTMTLCNNNATPSEKKEIKEEILKHSFLLLRLLLSLNNLFTYGLSTSLSYLSNIRVTVLRFVEIITSNTSEDVDFNPLLQILFRGLENQKSKSNQSSSCISLDKVVNEFSYGNYMLNKQRIQQLFQNFTLVSNFYFDQEGFLSRIQNSAEAQLVNEARNIETISFILKKIIKQLSDSSKKQLITKYFQRYHLNNINNCYQIAASVQRKYVKELFKLKLDDILIQRNLHYFLEENSRKQALINFINDEEQLKIFYKRTKCFLNVTRFGLSIDVHGACAEQMQAFVFIRDSIIQSFNYVFFGSVDAPKIFKKQKQTLQQEQQIKQQKDDNFAINNSQRNNKKNRNGNKQDKGKNGLILFLKSKSTTFNQKIVINQFVCMKYFNPLQKMMHFHLQSQFNAKSKKKVLYIESNSFINSIIHLFKNSLYHIQQCKEAFAKNQSQQPNFITGGAGGGGSSNINIGYLDVNLYSKKSCLAMSSFVQLIFQEFSVFLMHRFSGRDQSQENVQTKKEKPDEKTPLLEDTRQLVESVENVFSGQRRNINNNQLIFQDDNQFDDTTLSQLSSESMIDIFEEEISTLGEEDINLEEIIQINQDNNQLDYFSKSFESEQSIDDDDEFLESEENNPINKNSNQENSTQNSPENLNSDQNSLNSQTINHDSKNVDVIDQISAERPNSQNQNDQEQQIQQDALKNINQSQKDDDAEQIELEEQIYADKLEYEINQNKKFSQNGDFDQFQQKQEQFYLQDKNQHNSNLMENENQTLKNSLEISKAEHIKQRETLKKQKYEIYFIKLKYLLSIILNNLQQIETCDVSAIMIKIQEKQIGLKIDRLKAIQFFEILFDSIEQFDLYEAISFKQFMNNFYHPTFKDDLKIDSKHEQIKVQDNQKSENKSNSPRKNPKESECQVEFSELQNEIAEQINQNEKATIAQQKSNEIIDLEINKKQQEEDEKKKEQQFASIIQKINEKIKKNKLMFLDITVLNSNQSEKIIQNCKTVLNYIQDELIPEIQNINKTIQENIEFLKSSDQNQQQSIQNAIQDRKCKIINIIITLSVISYYLQFQLIKESEEKKIKQTFKIMSRSISIFQYCQDQVNSENFYLNESVYLQNQCQKKISLVQQNLAQRFMQLSFQLILVQREQSIKLFIHYNILQIARDIKISQVEVFRNNLSLVIYSIIYEIFNTPYNYCNNIEFSIKNHILTCSKSNYQKFQFSEKYAQPLDLNSYYNEAKQLIMKGPKNFMKAFYQIMSFDKQKKQKLKCLIKKKYRNKWCYPIKLDENQQKVIYQLFEICQNNEMEGQIYEGMAKQQDTLAGSNNYLVDEIETNCMNNFCFGKIILNLLQYYPCLVEFGQKIPEYQKILIDFMLQDSMGATKRLVKLYFTIYSLYHNNLNLIDDYWNLYINYIDQSISDWLVSTKNLQKLFQQLHMIDLLQETSAHLKFEQGLQYMKRFLQNILTKLWDGKQLSNNQCQKQDDLYYFQNYLNIPSLFAVFYKNYLKNCLYNLGFDDIFNQTQIYDYLKELKYCLQMTSMQNYIPALNNIFKQQNNQSNNNSTQNLIEKTTNQVQEQQVESNRQDTNLNNLSISQMDNIHQINLDQNRIDEIQLVSQEFPFALEDQDRTQEAQQEQLNEQMLTCCQQESEDQEPISMQQQSSQNNLQNGLDSQSNNKLQESFNEFSKQQQIIKRQDDEKENLQKCDISELTNMQSSSENDLFEGLKELQYGLKIDGAAIPTNYVFQVGIKYCGIVENKFCNQQSLSQFMGRDIQVIINDSSQYIMTNTYYKTKWKNSYNQFPLSQQNLQASLQKYFQKIPTENTKFSLLKEVNKIALFKYQQIQLKIQNQKGKDFIENKQLFKILSNKRNNNKQIHSGLDIDKNEQTAIKKLLAEEKKQSILDDSPKSNSQSKQQASDKKSSSKFKSYEAFKDQELSSDEEEKEKEDGLLTEIYENNKEIIINYYTNKLANDEQQKEQLQEVIQKHIQEVKKLLRPVKASEIRNKILTVIAKYFYYDVSYICQRIKETLANNSFTFVKELFEYFAPFNNDIFLQNEVTSLQKVSESNAQIVKTFITLFNQLFPGQNLLNVLPIKDDSTNHLKILIQGKEYPFLQNRNPYTIEKASKNKFDKKIADIIVDQTKKINQYNQKVKQQLQQNKTKVDTSISTKQLINQFLSPTSIKEEDSLINYQTINIYSVMNNQKSEIKLRKSYFDIIFGEQFQDLLIEFPNQIIEVSLTMQEQLCCEEDYLATIQSSSDQYEFLLIFFQHPENRKYLMKQMKLKMEILQNNKQKQFEENNQNKSSVYNLQDLGEQNNQLQFNSYQRKNYSFEELKTMLQNRYLLFLNLLISNNEGIYELFLDSGDDFSIQTKETDNIQRYKENEFISVDSKINRNYKDEKQSSMIQNFIREMGKSEYTIKSIQHQKTIKSNYKLFVTFYTLWFDRSFLYFKESFEPFFDEQTLKKRESSINKFILNQDFIKVYTAMLLNDLNSTNYKAKINFHIEKIMINLNKEIIFSLIKEISNVIVEQIEPVVNKLLECIKRIYKQMKSDLGNNPQNLEKIDNNDRDVYYNSFQQQSSKYVDNLHSKCDKQFYLIKYMNNLFKIMIEQKVQSEFPVQFKQQIINNIFDCKPKLNEFNTEERKIFNDIQQHLTHTNEEPIIDDNIQSNKQINQEQSHLNAPLQNVIQFQEFENEPIDLLKKNNTFNNQILSNKEYISADNYYQRLLECLRNYEESIKEKYEEILLDSGCFNLYSQILIFSKYYSISLQAGLIYNDRQSKYFSNYSYFSKSYQSLFYLYKIIHSNHYSQVDSIIKGSKDLDDVEECFDFPSDSSIDQNEFLLTLQRQSLSRTSDLPKEVDLADEERKDKNTQLHHNYNYADHIYQTVSSVSLQEKEENTSSLLQNHHLNIQNNSDKKEQFGNQEHYSNKLIKTAHNLEEGFDDEDFLGLNSISLQELNLSNAVRYHELFKFFIRLENVIYFCIVRTPQDFAKIITQPLKDIQNRYSLHLKKMLIVSQTKFRVKKNINNNYTSNSSITIDRTKMVEESIPAVMTIKSEQLCLNTLYVKWKYESGIDEGGPRREWFSLIFNQLLDPNFGLFVQSKKNYTYMPNPFSFLVPDHLIYFKFLGILLGKAFLENYPVQANFAKPFLKLFLKKKIVISDIEEIDPELYKNLNWLLKNQINADEIDINFAYDKFYAGQKYEIELKKNGRNMQVCNQNKKEYVKSICHAKLIREIYYQAHAITSGFKEIVCEDLLQILDEQMLSFIFSGNPEISIPELKETIQLQGYTKNDKQIKWLFEILESFNNYEKSCFIFFITGSMNLPHGGFKQFPITITLTQKVERLPVSHTCANSIDLPNYPTKERLEDALRKALFECQGFELA